MGESMATFPTEIWIHIVSKAGLEKPTLTSISLVSTSLREVAQRELFRDVTFHYQSSLGLQGTHIDWDPYQQKVLAICRSLRLRSFIQSLRILFCNDAPWDFPQNRASDTVFCKMMKFVAAALPSMIILLHISYNAPFLLEDLHRAILLHPHVRGVVITPSTRCKTPCAEASIRRGPRHALRELEIAEWSPTEPIHGVCSRLLGPRRCALTSNMLVTHSLSLRKLRVPLLLLYDAVVATSTLPEFPHLESLSVGYLSPMVDSANFRCSLEDCIKRFLLSVHETVRHLDWRGYAGLSPFETLPPSCFPNLETLEGEGIECMLGNHSLRRLRLIAPPGPAKRTKREEEKKSIQALRECQMSSPDLAMLVIHQFIITWEFGPVIAAFSALEELSCMLRIGMGPVLTPDLTARTVVCVCYSHLSFIQSLGFTPLTGLVDLVERLFNQCIPSLHHLHTLSICAYDTGFNEPAPLETIITLASSLRSDSLKRFNFQLAVNEPDPLTWPREVYESMELHKVCDVDGGGSKWTAPRGKVTIMPDQRCHIHCEVHDQCSLSQPFAPYEGWIEI